MAGSLDHVRDGWSMIENMGDAYEAVEEMFFVIESIPAELVKEKIDLFYRIKRREVEPTDAYIRVQEAMEQ